MLSAALPELFVFLKFLVILVSNLRTLFFSLLFLHPFVTALSVRVKGNI